jgi:PAS domain S-box-containing protein
MLYFKKRGIMAAFGLLNEDKIEIQMRKRIAELEKDNKDLRAEILERKQEEEKLASSSQQLSEVLESISDGFYSLDHNWRLTYVNSRAASYLRLKPEDLIGRQLWERYPQLVGTDLEVNFRKVMQERQQKTFEMHAVLTDRWHKFRVYPSKVGISVYFHDITERKRTEEALKKNGSLLKAVSENIQDAIYLKDREGFVVFVNPVIQHTIGKTAEQILGYKDRDLYEDPAIFQAIEKHDKEVMSSGKPQAYEETVEHPAGKRVMLSTKAPWLNEKGEIVGIVGILKDITEHKRAEEALKEAHSFLEKKVKERTADLENAYNLLKESEGSLSEAQKLAHIGNWDRNFITNEVYWSDEVYRIFGFEPQEFGVTYSTFLSRVHPDDQDRVIKGTKQALENKRSDIDYRIALNNGEERIVHEEVQVVFDEKNNPVRLRGTVQDITGRKKTEEFLVNLEAARQKEIHHRVKNNLQVISSLLDLQAEKFSNRECIPDYEVLEVFKEIQNRVISIALIHEQLHKGEETDALDFTLYLQELVEKFFQTYRLRDAGIRLNTDLEENIFFGMNIAVPLGIIVNELISNSFKYAFPNRETGEIQVKLFSEEARDEPNNKREVTGKSTGYSLIVSDNGVGIPESIDFKNPETLGLQLLNILVEQIDGCIELKRDRGTEFIISFSDREE